MQKREKSYRVISVTLDKEVDDILNDIVKQAIAKGNRINKSHLIESLIVDSLRQTYIQTKLQQEKEKEN